MPDDVSRTLREDHLRYCAEVGLHSSGDTNPCGNIFRVRQMLLVIRQVSADLARGCRSAPSFGSLQADAQWPADVRFPDRCRARAASSGSSDPESRRSRRKISTLKEAAAALTPQTLAEEYSMKASALDVGRVASQARRGSRGYRKALEHRSLSRAGANQPREHPLRQRRARPKPRRFTSARSGSKRISSKRTSISETSITTSAGSRKRRLLPRGAAAEPPMPTRTSIWR